MQAGFVSWGFRASGLELEGLGFFSGVKSERFGGIPTSELTGNCLGPYTIEPYYRSLIETLNGPL